MALSHDFATESHTGTTASVSQASFSWTHTPASPPIKGVLIWVWTNDFNDFVTSVTYGGVNVPKDINLLAADISGEPGRIQGYFLGSGIPTGSQTVVVNRVNNTVAMSAVCISVKANTAEVECYSAGVVTVEGDGVVAQQNVTDASPGTNSVRYAAGHFGHQTLPSAGANSTLLQSIDIGASGFVTVRETTAGQGSRPIGMSSGVSDDRAIVHVAVREKPSTEISGQALTLGRGSLSYIWKHNLVGQALALAQGALAFTWLHSLPGRSLSLSQGTPSVTAQIDQTVNLTGQALHINQSPTIDHVISIGIIGQSLLTSHGDLDYDWKEYISGRQLTLSQGVIGLTVGINLTGQQLTLSRGTPVPVSSVDLVGRSFSFAQGTIVAKVDYTFNATSGTGLTWGQGGVSVDISGGISQTINLTGQALLHFNQSSTITTEVGAYTSSRLLTLAQGSIVVNPVSIINLTGQALTLSRGTPFAGPSGTSVSISGQTISFTQSSTIETLFGPVLTGQSLAFSQGSVSVNIPAGGLISVSILGQTLNIVQSPNVVEENQPFLLRQSLTFGQGIPTIQTFGTNDSVNLTGQALSLSQGTVFPLSANFIPLGRQLFIRQAISITRVDIGEELSGQALTLSQGNLLGIPANVLLTGQSLLLSRGTPLANSIATVNLTGQALNLNQGTVTLPAFPVVVTISGHQLNLSQNTVLGFSLSTSLFGQSLLLRQGSVTVEFADFVTASLTGQALHLAQGSIGYSDEAQLNGLVLSLVQGTVSVTGISLENITNLVGQNSLSFRLGCIGIAVFNGDDGVDIIFTGGDPVDANQRFDGESGVLIILRRECLE